MEKIIKKILFVFIGIMVFACTYACGKVEEEKPIESVKEFDASTLKAYSMDLSDIDGYSQYVVENGTWQETYDVIIQLSKKEADITKRTKLYHKAEDLLMSTGCIIPIYYYTDLYMLRSTITGFYGLPTGAKYFKYTKVGDATTNINVCLASEPDTIDPALNSSVDGATMILHTFSGLVGYDKDRKLVADLAKELPSPVVNEDGSVTYIFELRDGIKWSDGSPITAEDFVYAWNRAISAETAADYGYLFEVVSGYASGTLDVHSLENGKKLSVTLPVDVPYFFELCAFPTFMPIKKATVDANGEEWATSVASYITSGAYTMTAWEHNSKIELTKNPNYWNAAGISMEKITLYLSDDDTAILANYKNGTYDFIDTVPNDEISNLKVDYPAEFKIDGQLGTYYAIFNNNTDLVPSYVSTDFTAEQKLAANVEIRNAISLLLDRNYICEAIGQAGQKPASSFVAYGMTEADGKTQFNAVAGGNTYDGYFDVAEESYAANCEKAVEALKKYFEYDKESGKFINFTTFEYLYNTSSGHQAIGEYIQSVLAEYGITISLVNQEWNTFLQTRKDGAYTSARNGWSADYNDPINMLDMWTSYSGNNDAQFGK